MKITINFAINVAKNSMSDVKMNIAIKVVAKLKKTNIIVNITVTYWYDCVWLGE